MKNRSNTYWTNMAKCLLIVIMSSFGLTSCQKDDVDVTAVTLDKTTLELTIGSTAVLNATVSPSNATDKTVVWSSNNTSVATVNGGEVTAVGAGTATITATAGGKTATCVVAVETPIVVVASISLDNQTLELNIGEMSTLVATVAPDNATDKTVTWTSSDANVATINNGVVTAIAAGTSTITATSGDQSAICTVTVSSFVAINATTFPDDVFRAYVYNKFDTDADSAFSESEIANVTSVNVGNSSISSLSGIEYFTQLTRLVCYSNLLSSLDVSKNTNLSTLYCYNNSLTSLNLSNNTQLTELYCYENGLTSLNLNNNTLLSILNCSYNELTGLDLSNNTQLTALRCSNNKLTSLNTSNDAQLVELYCHNNNLATLDLSDNAQLTTLHCYNNALVTLELDNNTQLSRLYCENNNLTALNVENNTQLRLLSCHSNNLNVLDLDSNVRLAYLYCNNNNLTDLSLANNAQLSYLECFGNGIETLDISNTLVASSNSYTAYLGSQSGTITVTMTLAQSDIFNTNFAADEKNNGVVIDVLP